MFPFFDFITYYYYLSKYVEKYCGSRWQVEGVGISIAVVLRRRNTSRLRRRTEINMRALSSVKSFSSCAVVVACVVGVSIQGVPYPHSVYSAAHISGWIWETLLMSNAISCIDTYKPAPTALYFVPPLSGEWRVWALHWWSM